MKKNKWLALCLSAVSVLSLSALAACSLGDGTSTGSSSSPSGSEGDSSSSSVSVSVHEHSYKYQKTLLPTKTADGKWAHYTCDGCDEIFDLNKTKTTESALKITTHLAENSIYAEATALNAYDGEMISVYDAESEVSVSEVKGNYMIAVDASGKIVYASNYESGYGGPADDFYHDGSYSAVAGQQCGIFTLYDDFDRWPNTTTDGNPAWERYEIDLPDGWHIISGSASAMKDLISSFTDKDITVVDTTNKNQLFGADIGDGYYNDTIKINVVTGCGSAFIDVQETERQTSEGLTYSVSGGAITAFEKQADGTYVAEFELAQWKNVTLTWTDAEENETTIWYDNTTISGMVTAADVNGANWEKNVLYHESNKVGLFYHHDKDAATYRFVYNPEENTLNITVVGASTETDGTSAA